MDLFQGDWYIRKWSRVRWNYNWQESYKVGPDSVSSSLLLSISHLSLSLSFSESSRVEKAPNAGRCTISVKTHPLAAISQRTYTLRLTACMHACVWMLVCVGRCQALTAALPFSVCVFVPYCAESPLDTIRHICQGCESALDLSAKRLPAPAMRHTHTHTNQHWPWARHMQVNII